MVFLYKTPQIVIPISTNSTVKQTTNSIPSSWMFLPNNQKCQLCNHELPLKDLLYPVHSKRKKIQLPQGANTESVQFLHLKLFSCTPRIMKITLFTNLFFPHIVKNMPVSKHHWHKNTHAILSKLTQENWTSISGLPH